MTYEEAFKRLERSAFRRKFHLSEHDRAYALEKGIAVIRQHAEEFVHQHLGAATPEKDGKQTPWRGHPVFTAQHATATCCRGCLEKWWHVKRGVALTSEQEKKIVHFIIAWIRRDLRRPSAEASEKPAASLGANRDSRFHFECAENGAETAKESV